MVKNIVILSGAGISAESGISTFRDSNGLWEGYDIMEVASMAGWQKNPNLVLDFYNKRRRQLKEVEPNIAHKNLVQLEKSYKVDIVTQNVDDLHERAGSTSVMHLHGELFRVCSEKDRSLSYYWKTDLQLGDFAEDGEQLRPDIVWFGEAVPLMEKAIDLASKAHILVIIGTSLQVYPAANLMEYCPVCTPIFYIDVKADETIINSSRKIERISATATEGTEILLSNLMGFQL